MVLHAANSTEVMFSKLFVDLFWICKSRSGDKFAVMAAENWIAVNDGIGWIFLIWGKSAKNRVERSKMQSRERVQRGRGRNSQPETFREIIISTPLPSTKKIYLPKILGIVLRSHQIWCEVRGRGLCQFQWSLTDKIIPESWSTWRIFKHGHSHSFPTLIAEITHVQ